jgi:hypothetical protein
VEAKAHRIDGGESEAIMAKYRRLGFRELVLLAPGASSSAQRVLANSRTPSVEFLAFRPETAEIREWYRTAWPNDVPHWVHATLASGRHHLRFVLSQPATAGRLVIGQQRSRVYSVEAVARLMDRLPSAAARVLWTPQRFTIPRDLIARKSRVTPLGGFIAVDIDGDRLHRAAHACLLPTAHDGCPFCRMHADREGRRLIASLATRPVDVLASGGRGVHLYFEDAGGARQRLLDLARRKAARIDENISSSLKATIALPGSLHAGSMRPVASLAAGLTPPSEGTASLCS